MRWLQCLSMMLRGWDEKRKDEETMRVLGISGSLMGETWSSPAPALQYRLDYDGNHDAAAVLLENGRIVAAVEQERIDRIKHSGSFPIDAIEACLRIGKCKLADVDLFAFSYSEQSVRSALSVLDCRLRRHRLPALPSDPSAYYKSIIDSLFCSDIGCSAIRFYKHHLCHAASAFWPSGYDRAAVVTIDGAGEDESGSVCIGRDNELEVQKVFPAAESIGWFYLKVINLMGFRLFEEYKVMGLAPYGDPSTYRIALSKLYELRDDGGITFGKFEDSELFDSVPRVDQEGSIPDAHMHLAAAAQEALETMAMHVLANVRRDIGLDHLCLAGGVAHNCVMNGKLRNARLFSNVYVQPAANDAGLALGAALLCHRDLARTKPPAMTSVYLGTPVGGDDLVRSRCRAWRSFVDLEQVDDIATNVAERIAKGDVVGWAQGRSEFGPRALGNRSILADPRPVENKNRINAVVKKREGFRPFAPVVPIEDVTKFFEVEEGASLSYMLFVVQVRAEWRTRLGAITHVDGSARVQTVARDENERLWKLLKAFGSITGVPILLNTSFNGGLEPIVDSVDDAIRTFLRTDLDLLVLGNSVVRKKGIDPMDVLALRPVVPANVVIETRIDKSTKAPRIVREFRKTRVAAGSIVQSVPVSSEAHDWIMKNGFGLCASKGVPPEDNGGHLSVTKEVLALWNCGFIDLVPYEDGADASRASELGARYPRSNQNSRLECEGGAL